ncbi:hypothetical protein ACWFMI_25290 [Nocardiopsis terrae]|uniref:hypothetical protein n=1 Tax=Streptomyces sp. NPDC057554 TaxID=3350538 RepID=UPI0036C55B56
MKITMTGLDPELADADMQDKVGQTIELNTPDGPRTGTIQSYELAEDRRSAQVEVDVPD